MSFIYDKNSFIGGIQVGIAIKELTEADGILGYEPRVWYDPGSYEYFYIDYRAPLKRLSTGLFRNSTVIVSGAGVLTPSSVTAISETVYMVSCNIQDAEKVSVLGRGERGLLFQNGVPVPGYETSFYVGEEPYSPGYLYDTSELERLSLNVQEDDVSATYALYHFPVGADSGPCPEPREIIFSRGVDFAYVVYLNE